MHAVTPLNRPRGYAIAASALIIATFARMALAPVTGDEFPLITYYIAVLAVAWTATLGPALFTFVSGAVLAKLLFSPDWHDWGDYLRYFIVAGAALVAMRAALSRALRQRAFVTGTMQTALDSIVTIDQHDRILEFNPAAERTFGFRRGDVIGRELGGLIIPERYRERHRVALKRYLETGEKTILDRRLELAALRADGAEIPIELAVTQVSTKPPAFTAYIRDLTEKRAAEHALRESEQRFRGLIEQVPDYAIFFTDRDGLATSWNEGVRRVLGFVQEEFIGCDITKAIFTPEDVRAGVPLHELETAAREGTASNDRWMMRKGGKRFFALGVTVARRNAQGELEGFAKIMRDRTDMKKLEDDLNATVESLEGINERQAQFLAMLSHELRNPLAPIRTAVEVLKITRGQGGEAAQAIDVLSRQVTQLVRLVDDLLDLNRIRTGKIQLAKERVDLRAALAHAVEIAQAQCVHYQHHLDVSQPDDPVYIEGDPARIGQVVSNLLHNACKFTPTGGRVELTLAREEGDAVIRVRDTGVGIPGDKLERIFGMFEQLDNSPRAQAGLGIGLSLSRSLVELHGGSIAAHSGGSGEGSEFIVRLPLARAQVQPMRAAERHDPPQQAGRRVLVVDDNRDAAESLAMIVRLTGHEVACAHDGEEALAKAKEHRPEVVLLDIGLPRLDGYQVARAIRADPTLKGTTLVAITGWGQEEDVRRAMEAGFDAHFTKPIEHAALLEVLRAPERDLRSAS